jgi:oxygen-dependent protoporphyrinogen oxidase
MGIPCDLADSALTKILTEKDIATAQKLDAKDFPSDIDPEITLGELVRLRMGEPVVRRILTPVIAGVHAVDPDLVEAEAVVPGLLARCREVGSLAGAADSFRSASGAPGSAINGLRGGMTTLINALLDSLDGVNVKSNRTVTAVRKSKTGWIVETADVSLRTDNVVLALSAPAARRVLRGQDRISAALEKFSVGDVAVVSLVVQNAKLDKAPVGSGVLVDPDQTSVRAKALTHASAKWDWIKDTFGPGTHLIRLSYGRNGVIEESLDELPDLARRDAEVILGVKLAKVTDVKVTRWPDSLVHPRVGHRQNVQTLQEAVNALEGLAIIGAGIGGNGIAGSIAYSRTLADQLGIISE